MSQTTLEDFKADEPDKYTEELIFLPGAFRLSHNGSVSVPYFATVMPLQDLVNQIKLVEDLPEEVLLDWSLEELFQRDIDQKRVERELVNHYLNDSRKISFFNSLTIALLPKSGFTIDKCYGEPDSKPTDKGEDWERSDVGNICVDRLIGQDIGVIRWHKERIFPVAIDGQHRLAALRQYYEERKKYLENSPEFETKISLILLVLDERVGFTGRSEKPIIDTLREIFIDLNKNARHVPHSRLILLQNQDIQSLCVRTLLADKAKESSPDVLPLSIVTWRNDEPKFDSGYSITSVLNLDKIVSYCLNGASLEKIEEEEGEETEKEQKEEEKKKIQRYVDRLTAKLELNPEVEESIRKHIQSCVSRREPFSFEDSHLKALKEAFRQQWAPHIVHVFRKFAPYKKYLSTAKEIGAIDKMLADYLLRPVERREEFEKRKTREISTFNPDSQLKEPLRKLENLKANEWAFQVVFQKALFTNLLELESESSFFLGDETSKKDFLTWWIDQVNTLHKQGVFNLDWKAGKKKADLWLGIANNPGSGSIQYSQAATNRISSFITLCIYFKHGNTQQDESKFANSLIDDSESLPKLVRNAFKRIKNGFESLVKAKMDTNEIDGKPLEREIKRELVKRLKAIQE